MSAASRRGPRSRSNTTSSFRNIEEEEQVPEMRIPIRSRQSSVQNSPRREMPGFDFNARPSVQRNATFEGPRSLRDRDDSPSSLPPRLSRAPTDTSILGARSQLRSIKRDQGGDVFGDQNDDRENFDYYDDRSASPAPSNGSSFDTKSRSASWAATQELNLGNGGRKAAPPPPPSRSKKPPPPPPMKRSALSTSAIPLA